MNRRDKTRNHYAYGPEEVEWFSNFNVEPLTREEVNERINTVGALRTVDIPEYLRRVLDADVEPALAQYRLTQLFGTCNVPGYEIGKNQLNRNTTTWQYVFRVIYEGDDETIPDTFFFSLYDYKTDLSIGFVTFTGEGQVKSPTEQPPDDVEMPQDNVLIGIVQLGLNIVEHPIKATYKQLWV